MVNDPINDYISPLSWHQNAEKNAVYLSSYSPLNKGDVIILTNSMLQTYTSDIDERIDLR